jgi:hypothetical protein
VLENLQRQFPGGGENCEARDVLLIPPRTARRLRQPNRGCADGRSILPLSNGPMSGPSLFENTGRWR